MAQETSPRAVVFDNFIDARNAAREAFVQNPDLEQYACLLPTTKEPAVFLRKEVMGTSQEMAQQQRSFR